MLPNGLILKIEGHMLAIDDNTPLIVNKKTGNISIIPNGQDSIIKGNWFDVPKGDYNKINQYDLIIVRQLEGIFSDFFIARLNIPKYNVNVVNGG